MAENNRLLKIQTYWPIIVTALAITVTAASANTRLDNVSSRVDYLYNNGSPVEIQQLTRVVQQQNDMLKTLDRVETKVDTLESESHTKYVMSPRTRRALKKLQ